MEKITHIKEANISPPKCIGKIQLNDDDIGYAEAWDFSRANLSEEHRKFYITKVASVCYQNQKSIGSISLYDRLMCESHSLPSSSFEFVPILLEPGDMYSILSYSQDIHGSKRRQLSIEKYGEFIPHDDLLGGSYLLTNL